MSRDYNKAIIKGRLGADPEVRVTPSGKTVTSMRVATSRGSGDSETTTWHRVVAWEKLAETAGKYLKKGREVLIEGRLDNREWTDKNGSKQTTTEIIASEIVFVGSKPEGEGELVGTVATRDIMEKASSDFDGEDLPF